MVNKYFSGKVPNYEGRINKADEGLEIDIEANIKEYEMNMDSLKVADAYQSIWTIIGKANKYIDETAPWTLFKEEKTQELASCMYHLAEVLRIVAILIRPAMRETSDKIFNQLNITDEALKEYDSIYTIGNIKDITVVEKGEPIFLRLDADEEIEYIKSHMK
jgi:methionyl-tRNA synthetase